MKYNYFMEVLQAFDRLGTAILGGWSDETISSWSYRNAQQGRKRGRVMQTFVNWLASWVPRLFFRPGQPDHCHLAYENERERAAIEPMKRP